MIPCRNCGQPAAHKHHVIPRSKHKASKYEPLNLLALCMECHSRWHEGKRNIPREVFTKEEWDYLSSVKLTGQNVIPWLEDHYPSEANGS